jgi:protein-(glutamine-N5) methyltransferase, release factor-specific
MRTRSVSPARTAPSVGALLRTAAGRLQVCGVETPRLDAELLLAHALRRDRAWLFAHAHEAAPAAAGEVFKALLSRRVAREPMAYILGCKEFWSREFTVSPAVLIPRPETEHLIEAALAFFPDRHRRLRCCDIGTGSGCLAVTLACEYPQSQITATDLSAEALEVARANAEHHGVGERMRWRCGDLFAALHAEDGPFDLIICNPPYVSERELAAAGPELTFEPRPALTDGADGLTHLKRLLASSMDRLAPGGCLIVECGRQGLPASPHMRRKMPIFDLAGHLRGGVFVPRRP